MSNPDCSGHGVVAPVAEHAWPVVAGVGEWSAGELTRLQDVLSPPWRMLLAGDASPTRVFAVLSGWVTRHLAGLPRLRWAGRRGARRPTTTTNLTRAAPPHPCAPCSWPTRVNVLDQVEVGSTDPCPPQCAVLPPERMRRRVVLHNGHGDVYAFAVSWWGREEYRAFMADASAPIGASMASTRLEVHREIYAVSHGTNPAIARMLGAPDDSTLWCRHYMMWSKGKPLCLICEVFPPSLARWLGPSLPTNPHLITPACTTPATSMPSSS